MHDSDLSFITGIVNKMEGSFGVTLFLKGTVVSGWVISGSEYYSTLVSRLEAGGEFAQAYAIYFQHQLDSYTGEELEKIEIHNYLHLKNVKIQGGTGEFTVMNNSLLRLKISEIDGHIIGSI